MNLLCERNCYETHRSENGGNLAEYSEEGLGSNRAALPMARITKTSKSPEMFSRHEATTNMVWVGNWIHYILTDQRLQAIMSFLLFHILYGSLEHTLKSSQSITFFISR
jgi:hypothetical protein